MKIHEFTISRHKFNDISEDYKQDETDQMMSDERAKANNGTRTEKRRKINETNRVKYKWPVH